ncbi:MAG: hypothetical protein AB7O39_03385 [Flavobacteriaceae bacterium]
MTRSLDFDRAMRARYENGRHADRLMTDIRKALQALEYELPMTEEERRALLKVRWRLVGSIDDLLEDDRIMGTAESAPAPMDADHIGTFTHIGVPAAKVATSIGAELNRQSLTAIKNIVQSLDLTDAAADVFKQKDAAE